MRLDLAQLREMHPAIPLTRAADLVHCAALGLQRNGHASGAPMRAEIDGTSHDTTLAWTAAADEARTQLDRHRITEDAAEAISLVLVAVALNWVIRRRGQRGDHADWIMRDRDGRRIALEISGTDAGDHARRLRDKTRQAGRSLADQHAACVVELATPLAALATSSVRP